MAGPFKMKAGKEGPMKKNFGISPMKQDKMKASQTKIDAKTGVTTVDENPGSKKKKSKAIEMPTPNINPGKTVKMPSVNINPGKTVKMPSPKN